MIIIGVDPGTAITGFGIIKWANNSSSVLDYGVIKPPAKAPLEKRYYAIFTALDHLLTKFKPDFLSVETQFVNKNVQSAIKLGMARGACLIVAAKHDIPVHEYAPTVAKKAVVGKGHASKLQVQKMVRVLLKLEAELSEDTSDALALALCHAHSHQYKSKVDSLLGRR